MAIYRTVSISFWSDSKVTDDFTPEDRYFYLYLFTNPHTSLSGCYEISIKQMALELGYSQDTCSRLIERFISVHNVIRHSKETKEILLLNWHKYNWTESPKFKKALLREIEKVKNPNFKRYLTRLANGESVGYGIDTTCIGTSVPVTDTVTVTDTVSVKSKHPTIEEVKAYCTERGNKVDPERWFDYYTSNGWKVGKNPMRDWKAAVRTWERTDEGKKYKGRQKSQTFFNYEEKPYDSEACERSTKELEKMLEEL